MTATATTPTTTQQRRCSNWNWWNWKRPDRAGVEILRLAGFFGACFVLFDRNHTMTSDRIRLYKYVPAEGARQILTNQSLRFTPLQEYNDPFEGENVYQFTLDGNGNVSVIDAEGKFRSLRHCPDLQAVEKARSQVYGSAACCFCERFDSVILWAHYADQHKGVCLEFEFPRFTTGFGDFESLEDGQCMLFEEVNYSKQRPLLLMNTDQASVVPYEMIEKSILTKSLDWAYEEEWRFVKRNSSEVSYERFKKSRLKRVIFGLRTPKQEKASLCEIVRSLYEEVVLAQAQKHQFGYAVEIGPDMEA